MKSAFDLRLSTLGMMVLLISSAGLLAACQPQTELEPTTGELSDFDRPIPPDPELDAAITTMDQTVPTPTTDDFAAGDVLDPEFTQY